MSPINELSMTLPLLVAFFLTFPVSAYHPSHWYDGNAPSQPSSNPLEQEPIENGLHERVGSIYTDILLAREAVAEAESNPWARAYPEAGTDGYPSDVHSHVPSLFSRFARPKPQPQPQPEAGAEADGHVPTMTPQESQANEQYLKEHPDTGKPDPFLQGTGKTTSVMGGNGQITQIPNDACQPSKQGQPKKGSSGGTGVERRSLGYKPMARGLNDV